MSFVSQITNHWRRNHDRERVAATREMFLIVVEALEHMEAHMTEITSALASEGDAISSLGASLTSTLGDLQSEIANLQANPAIPAGVLDTISQHVATLQGISAQVTAADPANAAPVAPVDSTPAPVDPAPVDSTPAPVDSTPVDAPVSTPDPGTPVPTDGSAPGTDTAPDAAPSPA